MTNPEPSPLDDQFARLLAAHDEQLLTGGPEPAEPVSPDLAPRLAQARAFIELLDNVWRRSRAKDETPPEHGETVHLTAKEECPTSVGRFQIARELGRGGGGVVYLAHDPALGRQVALKVPRLENILTPALRRRFLREGQAAAALNHPNIIPLHEAGTAGSVCYIVSAYCPGPTLAQWLRDFPEPVPPGEAAALIEQLAQAMAHAHQRGILHRDLKPGNILLQQRTTNSGEAARESAPSTGPLRLSAYEPKISDFGLAKVLDTEDLTETGVMLGTAAYMSPEQAQGIRDVGSACDVWSLGVVLYEVLTRQKPFPGTSSIQIMQSIQAVEPVSPRRLRADVSGDLETICLKCLEKEPVRRYASAEALAQDLRRFLRDEPIHARPAGLMERLVKWGRRRPARAAVVVLSCVILALVVGVAVWFEVLDRSHYAEVQGERYPTKFRRAWEVWSGNSPQAAYELLSALRPSGKELDQRGFEWYYLNNRARHAPKQVGSAGAAVLGMSLSTDGKLLAVGRWGGEITLLETTNWTTVGTLRNTGTVFLLAHSPNGRWLAAGGLSKNDTAELKLYDLAIQKEHANLSQGLGTLHYLAFSPDSTTLAGCGDRFYLFGVSPPGLHCAVEPKDRPDQLIPLIWTPGFDPTVGTRNGYLLTFDGTSGKLLGTSSTGNPIYTLARSPAGKTLALGGSKGVTLHPASKVLDQPGITSTAYSPDGNLLAAGGLDGQVCLWDIQAGQMLDKLASVSEKSRLARFAEKGYAMDYLIRSVAFLPNGNTLISAGDDGLIKLWDISQPELSTSLTHDLKEAWWVTFTPDGRTVIAGGDDSTVRLWDTHTKRELQVLRGHGSLVMSGAVSRDGKLLATGDHEGKIRLWELPQDRTKLIKSKLLSGHKGRIRALAFSPDGTTLASGSEESSKEGAVVLWDARTGKQRHLISETVGPVHALAFHPNGGSLAGGGGNDVSFWNPATGALLYRYSENARVRCLAYSPDGAVLALGFTTATVKLRAGNTGVDLAHFGAHTDEVRALTFSPDGTRLATSGQDRLIKLWHVGTGQELLQINWQKGTITGLAISPDGQTLASASHDGSVRLWLAPN